MDGLDKLITANGQPSAPIDNFVAASNFQIELQTARAIRDTVGAHIEIDDAHTIASLLADLDAYDLDQGFKFYERVCGASPDVHSILYLRMYAVDGRLLYGVSASHAPAVPYAGEQRRRAARSAESSPINDEEAYRKYLMRWLDGDDAQKGDAGQFFRHAFAGSKAIETIEEIERFGVAQRMSRHGFRKAHQFLSSTVQWAFGF